MLVHKLVHFLAVLLASAYKPPVQLVTQYPPCSYKSGVDGHIATHLLELLSAILDYKTQVAFVTQA